MTVAVRNAALTSETHEASHAGLGLDQPGRERNAAGCPAASRVDPNERRQIRSSCVSASAYVAASRFRFP